ncbi:hypothetical protein FS763_04465 [Agrobacterium vitis]|uniref:hypothetical protein n=1 Tax=Allorhizobium ampelinum TaxID=3025782 RepID=UPI001F20DA33|nr:hypothetical protein [Allorhizobium ampelinum]MCF1471180.1 hypothetical protein [Allorhizobium ampelinum]
MADDWDLCRARSASMAAAMAVPLEVNQALAAIILWNSGFFDTLDIARVLALKEDAVCRTIHAARDVRAGR